MSADVFLLYHIIIFFVAQVEDVIKKHKSELLSKRYHYNTGPMLGKSCTKVSWSQIELSV